MSAAPSCTIGRDYVGKELTADPAEALRPGQTSVADVLELFGAPNRIQRRHDGEVLVYRYVRNNSSQLQIEEPVITGISIFTYTKRQHKANRLTLFFDREGVLRHYGYTRAIEELDAL